MNLWKRACLYSIRKKGKAITLLAFLLVMAAMMLTCLSIQSATETANANIKKALLGYFTINAKHLEMLCGYLDFYQRLSLENEKAGRLFVRANSQHPAIYVCAISLL